MAWSSSSTLVIITQYQDEVLTEPAERKVRLHGVGVNNVLWTSGHVWQRLLMGVLIIKASKEEVQ